MLELIYSNLQFYKTVPSDLVSQSPGSRASMSHDTFAKQTGKKNYLYYPALKALNKEQERVQTLRIWSYLWSTVTWKLHLNRVLSFLSLRQTTSTEGLTGSFFLEGPK